LKIVYLHQYFNTRESAGGTRSYEMARRLVAAGHEVHMITSKRESGSGEAGGWFVTDEDGIQVHRLPVPYSNRMSNAQRIKAFLRFAWGAGPRAAAVGGDVVFATSTPLTIALPAVYAAKKNKIPLVFEVRDLWPELPIAIGALKNPAAIAAARRLERFAYHHSARVVVLSPGMKAGVVAAGYPEARVTVIPNGCDLDLFGAGPEAGRELRREYAWLGERPLVIYAGTVGEINGVDWLARLAAAVLPLDPDIRFLVVGDGKDKANVKAEAEKLGVMDRNFFMMPAVPKSRMPGWLSAADLAISVFVDLEAMWANSANKFFDALSAGRPAAINYGGWQADILRESGAGLALDVNDIDGSAKVLAKALGDRPWLAKAGVAARKTAEERFSRDKLAGRLESVLREAADERKGAEKDVVLSG
jgi:glycosyltransferase involved in cell wall biosynthesis